MEKESEKSIAFYAGLLTLTEVGVGSVLHAMHVPFTGQFLSLNQIAILSHAVHTNPIRSAPISISNIAALLKSLSPIGKRVTPMLALSMQGLLYTIAIVLFGRGKWARAVGATFSSLWSFIQPILLYSLIFGSNFWQALNMVNAKFLPEGLLIEVFVAVVALKVVVSICVALFAHRIPIRFFERMSQRVNTNLHNPRCVKQQLWNAFKDLFRPLFLLSTTLVAFLLFSTSYEQDAWGFMLLRPLAVGYLISCVFRLLPVEKLLAWVTRRKESDFQRSLQETIQALKTL